MGVDAHRVPLCLTESIHVSGTFQEYFNLVFTPGSIAHATLHQTTDNLTAVGLTTGEIYHNSGPLTQTAMGSAETMQALVLTFHNINHFVGPGELPNIYLRTLFHFTLDPETGEPKVEVSHDDVLCH